MSQTESFLNGLPAPQAEQSKEVYRPVPVIATNKVLKIMLRKIEHELNFIELFAFACYFGDELHKADHEQCLKSLRRVEALRGAISARL